MKKALYALLIVAIIAIGYVIYQYKTSTSVDEVVNEAVVVDETADNSGTEGKAANGAGEADEVIDPVFTQDCFPRTLKQSGVSEDCFNKANFGDNSHCTPEQLKLIKEYYEKGQENDPLNDGSGRFCADDEFN